MSQPLISLCHTTARLPDGWRAAAQAWFDNCDHPENVEHVLTFDEPTHIQKIFPNTKVGMNCGRHTAVAGWNLAAKLSTGKLIISLADDWFPCPHWDTELLKMIPDLDGEYVFDVDTCGNDHLLTFSLLTRAYLMKYSKGEGWLFYPEYTGMYADNDFTDSARLDKVIINARHLKFPHRHPNYFADVEPDAVHLWQGRPEAWRTGVKIYKKRCIQKGYHVRPILALAFPGERFCSTWVCYLLNLVAHTQNAFTVSPINTFSSNVYSTRGEIAKQIVESIPVPDFVLWIDDDNLLTVEQFSMLFESLIKTPEADMIAAWAYVQPEILTGSDARTSVGMIDESGQGRRLAFTELMEGEFDVKEVHYSGFPAVLMRGDMLEKVGQYPFRPVLGDQYEYGAAGEDLSFCIHARQKGCRIFVDRRVRVQHLKLRDALPDGSDPDKAFASTRTKLRDKMAKQRELAATK